MDQAEQPTISEQDIRKSKDTALRCINSIRYHKMGKRIAPVWPICPQCGRRFSLATEVYSISRTGFCRECAKLK